MNEEELYLQPYAWTERPAPRLTDYDEQRAWCLDRQNQPYLVRITDMPCRAFLEFAPAVMNDRQLLIAIRDGLRWRMAPDDPNNPGKKDIETGKAILQGFRVLHEVKFFYESRPGSAVELTVRNRAALQVAITAGSKGMKLPNIARPVFFRVWEAEITTAEKLRTQQRLTPSQWFTGQFRAVEPKRCMSTIEREFIAPAASLHGVTQKGADDFWSSHPKLFSVDIETYSSNYRRMPVREAATDVITMISVITQREGDMSTTRRFVLVDDQDKARLVYTLEERGTIMEDVDVRCYPNEGALLDGFLELLRAEDPEVLVGYNTTGFDIPYIDHRLGKKLKTWGLTSRIKGQVPYVKDRPSDSKAYGKQVFYELTQMEGRIHIDVRDVIRREYKLRSYALGYVSMEKLGETKHDVKPREMFEIYDRLRAAKTDAETQAAVIETMRVAAYCVQDSMLVLKLFEKLNMWLIVVETSNIVFCTPEQVFSRGQQMKCRAQTYDEAHTQGFIIDNQGDAHDYKGAYVQEPDTGLKDNVVVLDFTSLYPSIMIFYNICHTTILSGGNFNSYADDNIFDHEFDEEFVDKVPIDTKRGRAWFREEMKNKKRKLAEYEEKQQEEQEVEEEEEEQEVEEEEEEEEVEEVGGGGGGGGGAGDSEESKVCAHPADAALPHPVREAACSQGHHSADPRAVTGPAKVCEESDQAAVG